jgi:hypothetical protein
MIFLVYMILRKLNQAESYEKAIRNYHPALYYA